MTCDNKIAKNNKIVKKTNNILNSYGIPMTYEAAMAEQTYLNGFFPFQNNHRIICSSDKVWREDLFASQLVLAELSCCTTLLYGLSPSISKLQKAYSCRPRKSL